MTTAPAVRGPWFHRFLIWFFTILLALLTYWTLGFLIDDVGTLPGPSFEEIQRSFTPPDLQRKHDDAQQKLADVRRDMQKLRRRQAVLQDSTANSQRTMNQMAELEKLRLQKEETGTPEERQVVAEAERRFLQNQSEYQKTTEDIAADQSREEELDAELTKINTELTAATAPAQAEYARRYNLYLLRLAAIKLGVMLPFLAAAVFFFRRYRQGPYAPLVYAFGAGLLGKAIVVMHEYFPVVYFKYVIIFALLIVTVVLLIKLIQMITRPRRDWLLKQYREAYENFLCPVCDYPIRRGPMKYLYWTRRTLKKLLVDTTSSAADEPYVCPNCATRLFEECEHCHATRHALLPACTKCGTSK